MSPYADRLYSTVGCHPTRCLEFEQTEGMTAEEYFHKLLSISQPYARSKVIAIGECGLGRCSHKYSELIVYTLLVLVLSIS